MLRFRHSMKPQRMKVVDNGGPEARIQKLRQLVSGLIRYERIEPQYSHGEEARQYAERLIYLAVKNGDKHKATMELADYWLLEKDLVHKLFKVLVPRYQDHRTSYTDIFKKAAEYPGPKRDAEAVLELKGNPWPAVLPKKRDTRFFLSNQLLSAARKDFYQEKKLQRQAESSAVNDDQEASTSSVDEPQSSTTSSSDDTFSSSVDPPSLSSTHKSV